MDINPRQMASQMANVYVNSSQKLLDLQKGRLNLQTQAVNTLQTTLTSLNTALSEFSGMNKNIVAMTARSSEDTDVAVTADEHAAAGHYSLNVEQLATSQQLALGGLPTNINAASAGHLVLKQDGKTYDIDLSKADTSKDGKISEEELVRSINDAQDNHGNIHAMIVKSEGVAKVVLSAGSTGKKNEIEIDSSKISDAGLKKAFEDKHELEKASDAIVWLGQKGNGLKICSDSNDVKAIKGLDIQLKNLPKGEVTIDVTQDNSATTKRLQKIVDAYNSTLKTIQNLSSCGNAKNGESAGPMASDIMLQSLTRHLNDLIRKNQNGENLLDLGIKTSKDGTISIDQTRLDKVLNEKPEAINKFLNGTGFKGGFLKETKDYLDTWTNGINGVIHERKGRDDDMRKSLDQRQDQISSQYDAAFKRYLEQYTRLQALQEQIGKTMEMLSNSFANTASK